MEEAASENNASDVTPEADNTVDNQQEAQHNQFQNQKQQTAQQVGPAPTTAPQDEINGLATMMQKLLQGQQIKGKALNQVTTDISKMNHMFTDLSTKYNNVASHMRQIDIHIAQTAESVKRQQGTLPGKTDTNRKECSAVELRSGRRLPDVAPKKLTAAEKGKQKEGEQPRSDTAPLSDKETKQPTETDPAPAATPVEHVPTREYTPKVPYPVPAKKSRKDREEIKCKKMLEDLTIKLPLIDAVKMIPSLCSLMKGLVSGKITGDNEEILTDDPLELTLIQTKTEHNIMSVDSDGYNKMIDSAKSMEKLGADATSNHITQPRNQLDFRQLESDYRVTGGQLVAPRAGSQTDLPHHLISLDLSSDERPTLGLGTPLTYLTRLSRSFEPISQSSCSRTVTTTTEVGKKVERVEPPVAPIIPSITSLSITPSSLISSFVISNVDNLLDVDPLEPIRLELDEKEDFVVYTWPVAL
ncbi:hypothetical protein F2Q68_00044005 [Brassica cretica]|uniref:Uncharacterized protein n=1 Tax=Brassica cretica TaxID=69181 RepID=A0A8S9LKX4_BRACR|nr:hypothetical protein F2Q68_00044005 [Brassica cretica]